MTSPQHQPPPPHDLQQQHGGGGDWHPPGGPRPGPPPHPFQAQQQQQGHGMMMHVPPFFHPPNPFPPGHGPPPPHLPPPHHHQGGGGPPYGDGNSHWPPHPPPPHHPPPHGQWGGPGGHPPPPHMMMGGGGPGPGLGFFGGPPPHMMGGPRGGLGGPQQQQQQIDAPIADRASYPSKAFCCGLDGVTSPAITGVDRQGRAAQLRAKVEVRQDDDTTYVLSNGVPDYQPSTASGQRLTTSWVDVGYSRTGRHDRNPNAVGEQQHVFYLPRKPQKDPRGFYKDIYQQTGNSMWTPMGPMGVAVNGVPLFNEWARPDGSTDAIDMEAFDMCCGHPAPGNQYHYHQYPRCVRGSRALGSHYPQSVNQQYLPVAQPVAAVADGEGGGAASAHVEQGPSHGKGAANSHPQKEEGAAGDEGCQCSTNSRGGGGGGGKDDDTDQQQQPQEEGKVVAATAPVAVVAVAAAAGGERGSSKEEAEAVGEPIVAGALLELLAAGKGGGHSPIIGYAFDGFPIYGPVGWGDGKTPKVMRSSYDPNTKAYIQGFGDLDVCNGVDGPTPEYPGGVYHYHATVDADKLREGVVEPVYPYLLARYRGVPDQRNFRHGGGGGGGPPPHHMMGGGPRGGGFGGGW